MTSVLRRLRSLLFYRFITQVEAADSLKALTADLQPPTPKPELARPKVRTFAAWSARYDTPHREKAS